MTTLSLTHRQAVVNEDGIVERYPNLVTIYLDAPAETIRFYLEAQGDLAGNFYVTEWSPSGNDAVPPSIAGHTDGDEWLKANGGPNGQT